MLHLHVGYVTFIIIILHELMMYAGGQPSSREQRNDDNYHNNKIEQLDLQALHRYVEEYQKFVDQIDPQVFNPFLFHYWYLVVLYYVLFVTYFVHALNGFAGCLE